MSPVSSFTSKGRCSRRMNHPCPRKCDLQVARIVIRKGLGGECAGCVGAYRRQLASSMTRMDAFVVVRHDCSTHRSGCVDPCRG